MSFSWKLGAVIYCMCIHFNAVNTIHCMTGRTKAAGLVDQVEIEVEIVH